MTARTDDDLERLLRSTFRTHAADVSGGPAWAGVAAQPKHRRWIAPLIAAALFVALVGAYLATHQRSTAPASSGRDFTSFDVVGYPVTSRLFYPSERSVVVRTPHAPRSGDVVVNVYEPGTYEHTGLQHQRHVAVSGHPGYAGWDGLEDQRGKSRPLQQVEWQFAPHRWAVAQQMGGLQRVPSATEVLTVARATRPNTRLAQTTPFRLTALPAGFAFDHVEVQPGTGVIILVLQTRGHRTLTLTELPADPLPSDPGGSVMLSHDGLALEINSAHVPGSAPADRAAVRFVARHITWDTTNLRFVVP